jgi:hypothetical protein
LKYDIGTIISNDIGNPINPIGSMYAMYGNIYHQYTPNVSIYTLYTIHLHGSYGNTTSNMIGTSWVNNGKIHGTPNLVVGFNLPLLKMMEFKSVGMMKFPTDWKNKKCSKPPT